MFLVLLAIPFAPIIEPTIPVLPPTARPPAVEPRKAPPPVNPILARPTANKGAAKPPLTPIVIPPATLANPIAMYLLFLSLFSLASRSCLEYSLLSSSSAMYLSFSATTLSIQSTSLLGTLRSLDNLNKRALERAS
eukprot:NODE_759_length_4134_cov_0.728129.p5 type:complete len:136 gc:universal NODE_759_length_4134_cov_0.728129:1932-2339(+)